jgi:hypothetical protein
MYNRLCCLLLENKFQTQQALLNIMNLMMAEASAGLKDDLIGVLQLPSLTHTVSVVVDVVQNTNSARYIVLFTIFHCFNCFLVFCTFGIQLILLLSAQSTAVKAKAAVALLLSMRSDLNHLALCFARSDSTNHYILSFNHVKKFVVQLERLARYVEHKNKLLCW